MCQEIVYEQKKHLRKQFLNEILPSVLYSGPIAVIVLWLVLFVVAETTQVRILETADYFCSNSGDNRVFKIHFFSNQNAKIVYLFFYVYNHFNSEVIS